MDESANPKSFVPPAPVGSTYQKPTVGQELDREEREKFWNEMRDEEETRRREETARRRQQQEQFAKEHRELADKLHKAHLQQQQAKTAATAQQQALLAKSHSVDSAAAGGHKMGRLIAGRAQMFEQEMAKLAESAKPIKKPKNFKWEVSFRGKGIVAQQQQKVVPCPPPKVFECAFVRKGTATAPTPEANGVKEPHEPIVKTVPQIPVLPVPPVARPPSELIQQQVEEEPKKQLSQCASAVTPPPSEPTIGPPAPRAQIVEEKVMTLLNNNGEAAPPAVAIPSPVEQKQQPTAADVAADANGGGAIGDVGSDGSARAKALWDYQAEDPNEITFEPEDVITDIQMVHDGWWYGRAPNGAEGLFPSNYVKLIQ